MNTTFMAVLLTTVTVFSALPMKRGEPIQDLCSNRNKKAKFPLNEIENGSNDPYLHKLKLSLQQIQENNNDKQRDMKYKAVPYLHPETKQRLLKYVKV